MPRSLSNRCERVRERRQGGESCVIHTKGVLRLLHWQACPLSPVQSYYTSSPFCHTPQPPFSLAFRSYTPFSIAAALTSHLPNLSPPPDLTPPHPLTSPTSHLPQLHLPPPLNSPHVSPPPPLTSPSSHLPQISPPQRSPAPLFCAPPPSWPLPAPLRHYDAAAHLEEKKGSKSRGQMSRRNARVVGGAAGMALLGHLCHYDAAAHLGGGRE
ncbi:unnamed protein product [Closterium sp. Naga37s-1]|nr:unnamed protein product [Closterium sp. Naga37s-1]